MKTKTYVYGVEKLSGHDAWALFEACALGDVPKVKSLLAKNPRLVNAQFWYQFPIHMAVRAGHADIVGLLLDRGADPGQSRFTYNSWDKLLLYAKERGQRQVCPVRAPSGLWSRSHMYLPKFGRSDEVRPVRLRGEPVVRDVRERSLPTWLRR